MARPTRKANSRYTHFLNQANRGFVGADCGDDSGRKDCSVISVTSIQLNAAITDARCRWRCWIDIGGVRCCRPLFVTLRQYPRRAGEDLLTHMLFIQDAVDLALQFLN